MASISREFSGECFDFDRLSASCLGGLVSKREQKEAVSRLLDGKDVSVGGSCNWFWQEIELSCYSLPIFSASRALHYPYPRAFCTLSSFARIKRSRWQLVELNDRHPRSHEKIGDCEQSNISDFLKFS